MTQQAVTAPSDQHRLGAAEPAPPPARSAARRARASAARIGGERIGFAAAWVAVVVAFSLLLPESYFTVANLSTMLASQAPLLILALAATVPLTTGDFDLSIAGVAGLSSVTIGVLNVNYGLPIGVAVLAALVVGAAVGLINYLLVVVTGADSIVVTLGVATFLGGVVIWLSGSSSISGVSEGLVEIVIVNRFLQIPLVFYFALALTLIIWYVQGHTALGQRMLFVGQNREVARLSALRVDRIRGSALVVGGIIAAMSGVVSVGVSGAADPTNATALLLPAFAAAFLGAAALGRGRFSAWSCMLAVYFLVSGITGLQQLGAQSYVQSLFYGAALVLAVTFARLSQRRRDKAQASSPAPA